MTARIRIRFAKLGKIRWTSHRDTARMWERAFRRIDLPLAYTNGFSPRPKVSFGLALPTGYESVAEYLDVELDGDLVTDPTFDITGLPSRLSAALPDGVDAVIAAATDDGASSLQESVTSCTWRLAVVPAAAGVALTTSDVGGRAQRLLDADSVTVTRHRKGKNVTDDIRPAILSLRLFDRTPAGAWLECDLATQPRSLRPSELVAAFGPDLEERDVLRLHQWIERDGARAEPLVAPLAATDAPHAMGRAS